VKIVDVVTLQNCGFYATSAHWKKTRRQIHRAVKHCEWPIGTGSFTIHPQSGKKRGEGNWAVPIKNEFIRQLRGGGWVIEGRAKNAFGQTLGRFDAILPGPDKPIVVEWKTGNISSSHRSMNKMTMLVSCGVISAGVLVIPSQKLCSYLTDRIGNIKELEPYLGLWKSVPCKSGVLEVVVIEHDATSDDVPTIPKGKDGRSRVSSR
jgi:hypothetical protein